MVRQRRPQVAAERGKGCESMRITAPGRLGDTIDPPRSIEAGIHPAIPGDDGRCRYEVLDRDAAKRPAPDADLGRRLAEYVAAGGHLWADGRCAFLDEHAYLRRQIPGHSLDTVFGCHKADFVVARGEVAMAGADGVRLKGYRHEQHLEPTTGTVNTRFANGMPVVVRNRFGAGIAELAESHVTLRSEADRTTMDHLAGFARAAGAAPALEVTPGFEALLLEGPACDIMIVSSRPGHHGQARISAPRSYASNAPALSAIAYWPGARQC